MADKTDKPVKTEKKAKKTVKLSVRWWEVVRLVVLLSLVVAVAVMTYAYFRLSRVSAVVAEQIANVEQVIAKDKNNQVLTDKLEEVTKKAQELTARQEKLLGEWQAAQQGDMSRWQLAEARHLVELANQKAVYQQDLPMAVLLLQKASQVLQKLNSNQAVIIRRAIENHIQQLRRIPIVNRQKLYFQLSALETAVNHLPLNKSMDVGTQQESQVKLSASDSWWQRGWQQTWQALKQVIVVKQLKSDAVPLITLEDRGYLVANLQSKIDNAMWAVLRGDSAIYQKSLTQAVSWVQQFFDVEAADTKVVLHQLQTLSRLNVAGPKVNFDSTLMLFSQKQAVSGVA